MPELPEVETIRRGLSKKVINKKIKELRITDPKLIIGGKQEFRKNLLSNQFTNIRRRGKLLIFSLAHSDYFLLAHLKMTGALIYGHDITNKFTRLIIDFGNKNYLLFADPRRFGYARLVTPAQKQAIEQKFGVEPLNADFTVKKFTQLLQGKSKLKGFLLNQTKIAGIGNIYADETCFFAGVRPDRIVGSLTLVEIKKLRQGMQQILTKAIKYHGTSARDYRDSEGKKGDYARFLRVYKQQGKLCKRCRKAKIIKIKLIGRGTHLCPHCQK